MGPVGWPYEVPEPTASAHQRIRMDPRLGSKTDSVVQFCRLQMHSAGTCDLSLTRAQKGRVHIDCSHVLDAVGVFNWSEIADGYKIQLRGCKCHVWSVG